MTSELTGYDSVRILRSAARHFKQVLVEDCQRRHLALPGGKSGDFLAAYDFEDGVQMLLLNGTLPQDWVLNINSDKDSPLMLFFNVRGHLTLDYPAAEEKTVIPHLSMFLLAQQASDSQKLVIKGGQETVLCWLNLDRQTHVDLLKCLPDAVREEVETLFTRQPVLRIFKNTRYGMDSAMLVQEILQDEKGGLAHTSLAHAKSRELFSMYLRRLEEEGHADTPQQISLRPLDMEKILLARNLLIVNLQNAPTIEELSRQAGVNRQKLKQGFKSVFGKTINEYLRSERLKLARQLLASGQPIIRDVAAAVGYENASYFARRFKNAYGLYPNEYAQHALTGSHVPEL